ncbi:hypothetical protein DPX16_6620 [Anabarilius grahami]|uniref:Uncharacterized protein n=1 Tax=Anabarilius grahami TaxID=495550 RepID=A0A3N0Z282_ANAGA|nr:hypothetical protein DPX16_6620 [Anabarilius grahami]
MAEMQKEDPVVSLLYQQATLTSQGEGQNTASRRRRTSGDESRLRGWLTSAASVSKVGLTHQTDAKQPTAKQHIVVWSTLSCSLCSSCVLPFGLEFFVALCSCLLFLVGFFTVIFTSSDFQHDLHSPVPIEVPASSLSC